MLDLVDIGGAIDRRIGTYSGGMKRRLDLAAALIHNPQVLFLDEPTTGLDPASRRASGPRCAGSTRELGMTIFLTTQYLEEADALADRVGIIDRGRLVAEGSPDALEALGRAGRDRGRGHRRTTTVPWPGSRTVPGVDDVTVDTGRITISTSNGLGGPQPDRPLPRRWQRSRCSSLTLRTPTLDDVFAELTGSHIEAVDQ